VSRVFRGEKSRGHPEPGELQEYKARSMFEEYRGLTILFAILGLALTVYFIKWVVLAPKKPPPPIQSVYIEMVPQKPPPAP
jgi:hypothetical protein